MNAIEIITKKRDGLPLTDEEIHWFIRHYSQGHIPDYQTSALLMAIFFRGMIARETASLTKAMIQSGEQLDLSRLGKKVVDKHSSGGVGDKTTLVVGPIVAAAGLPVAKMSGRGLGFTGGTLDKLESIPGFRTQLSTEEFIAQVEQIDLVIAGTSASLAPADGKLYALRDVTATVKSLPLIASSIMSKKLAAGTDAIVLDVKVGSGAFMRTLAEGRELAQIMVDIGRLMGRDITALLSDMNQPLGRTVGNALEVQEAIQTLQGKGAADFEEHCLTVAAHMLWLGDQEDDLNTCTQRARDTLQNGTAWHKFLAFIAAQGGDIKYIETPSNLPTAPIRKILPAPHHGTLAAIDTREVGLTVVGLGGGRRKKGEAIDVTVGIVFHAKVGDQLSKGQPLLEIHAATDEDFVTARERLLAALTWQADSVQKLPLFHEVISGRSLPGNVAH